jgi:hypothetical protein
MKKAFAVRFPFGARQRYIFLPQRTAKFFKKN